MNPEMERLLELFDAMQNSSEAEPLFESKFDELHATHPEISHEQLRRIVRTAYLRWLRANQKPPTIPPTA